MDTVDMKFPNWRAVCPSLEGAPNFFRVQNQLDPSKVEELYKAAKIEAKASKGQVLFDYEYALGETIRFKGELLIKFTAFLKAYPGAAIYVSDDTRPVYAIDSEGNRCLLMPLMKNNTDDDVIVNI